MNYITSKFAKALLSPTFPRNKKSKSLAPSAASTIVNTPAGTKVVGACHRQQFYRIKGFEPDADASVNIDWTLSAIMGEKLHEMLVKLIDDFGFEMGLQRLTQEHNIYDPRINLSGRSDLIVWDHNLKEPIGVEIKSIGEYKAKKAMLQPIDEHILQAVVYLDFYNKNIPQGQKKINKWYIWYISRTENWSIKAKDHNSPFQMMWDFCIQLDNGVPIIQMADGTTQKLLDFSVNKIYDRYNQLNEYIYKDIIPPRDYDIYYSEEQITALYTTNQIQTKATKETIEKWLKKGAPAGKLKVVLGDSECMFCEYKQLCTQNITNTQAKIFSNLPTQSPLKPPPEENKFFI